MITAEHVFLISFGGGMLMAAVYFLLAAFYAHRHIVALDLFARGWKFRQSDFLWFKVLRLGAYAMACAWPYARRRMYPGKEFSELPGAMPTVLAFLFWWFLVTCSLLLIGGLVMCVYLEPVM